MSEPHWARAARLERQRQIEASRSKGRPASTYEKVIYQNYQKHIDEAIDNAFQNIMWLDSPPDTLQKGNGNSVAFPLGNMYTLLAIVGLQQTAPDKFLWKVIVSIVVNRNGTIHKEHLWTRKQKQGIINVGKAFFEGCGMPDRPMSYTISNHILVGYKLPNEDDWEVIKVAKKEREPKPPEKKKRTRKKKENITAQNDL